jgi:hypothetical protein
VGKAIDEEEVRRHLIFLSYLDLFRKIFACLKNWTIDICFYFKVPKKVKSIQKFVKMIVLSFKKSSLSLDFTKRNFS